MNVDAFKRSWQLIYIKCSKRYYTIQDIRMYIYIYICMCICTYKNDSKGVCSIQSAMDILNDSDKQQLLNNIEKWNCCLDNDMFDLIKYSTVKLTVGFLWMDMKFSEVGCLNIQD